MGMYPAGNLVKISPTVSGTAYTEGDIIFAKQEIKGAVPSRGGCSILHSVTMLVEGALVADEFTLLFFDNDTALGVAAASAMATVTYAQFQAASCIGSIEADMNGMSEIVAAGNTRLWRNSDEDSRSELFIKAAEGKTSIWVAMFQQTDTLDLVDTDSIDLTFGFKYLG